MGLPRKTPKYIESFLENSIPHIACLRDDNLLPGAQFGCVWRVYAHSTRTTRRSFLSVVERMCHWAQEHGAEAGILRANFPGNSSGCREGDYIVFMITDPVATRFENESLLPGQDKCA